MTKQVYWAVLLERAVHCDAVGPLLAVADEAARRGYHNITVGYGRTDYVRNMLAARFLKLAQSPDDTLVMLDNDHAHPRDIITRLVERDLPVVGCLAFKRGAPYDPCVFVRTPEDGQLHAVLNWEPDVYRCDVVGHAAIAIKRAVFDTLRARGRLEPWWRYEYTNNDLSMPSEDMYFCRQLEEADIPCYADMSLVSPHLTTGYVDEGVFRAYVADHEDEILPPAIRRPKSLSRLSIIIPSKGRPAQLEKCIDEFVRTTTGHDIEIIVVTPDEVTLKPRWAGQVKIYSADMDAVSGWNYGARFASGDALMLGADDLLPASGWLDAVKADYKSGYVGLPDGHTDTTKYCTHYIISREYAKAHMGGVLAIPWYQSWWLDVEAADRARRARMYHVAHGALVEHTHPTWGTAPDDDTYKLGEARRDADAEMYRRRRDAGFPDNFPPVL